MSGDDPRSLNTRYLVVDGYALGDCAHSLCASAGWTSCSPKPSRGEASERRSDALIISGCSNTEGTKPPSSEQSARRSGAVGTGGDGANLSDDDFIRRRTEEHGGSRTQPHGLERTANLDIKSFAQRSDHSPNIATRDVQVRPNKNGNDVTTKINQWAADTYPLTQKHLDTARTLETAVKNRSNN